MRRDYEAFELQVNTTERMHDPRTLTLNTKHILNP